MRIEKLIRDHYLREFDSILNDLLSAHERWCDAANEAIEEDEEFGDADQAAELAMNETDELKDRLRQLLIDLLPKQD